MVYHKIPEVKFFKPPYIMNDSNKLYTEHVRVHPNELYCFSRVEYIIDKRVIKSSSLKNLELNYNRTKLSKKSERKAERAIKYMLFGTNVKKAYNNKYKSTFEFKVNFITLTLSSRQQHSTIELKEKLLNQFLVEARKNGRWKTTFGNLKHKETVMLIGISLLINSYHIMNLETHGTGYRINLIT